MASESAAGTAVATGATPGDDDMDVVELLRELIRHPTPDPPGREVDLARHVLGRLERLGIEATLDEFAPGRANVLGRVRGSGARGALVFSAHLDTLPAGSHGWSHDPFAADVEDGRVYGRGAADMKSGMAAMIVAAARIAQSGTPPPGDLLLALSAGESSNCLGARRFIETGALAEAKPEAIIVSEPSSVKVLTSEKGALWLKLSAEGRGGHASNAALGSTPDNAITTLVDAISRLREARLPGGPDDLLGDTTWHVGLISGGKAVNLVAEHAEAQIDIRYSPRTDADALIEAVQAAVGERVAVSVVDSKVPVVVERDHPLVATGLAAVKKHAGVDADVGGVSYFSDGCVLVPGLGVPRIIIGPGELGRSGTPDEYCEVARLRASVDVFEELARSPSGLSR